MVLSHIAKRNTIEEINPHASQTRARGSEKNFTFLFIATFHTLVKLLAAIIFTLPKIICHEKVLLNTHIRSCQ